MAPEWPAGNEACTQQRSYEVDCVQPDPDTTRGEARTIVELADTRGWDSMILVTSDYHVTRAGLLLDRCFDGEVVRVAVDADLEPAASASRIGHEWFATVRALVVERSC